MEECSRGAIKRVISMPCEKEENSSNFGRMDSTNVVDSVDMDEYYYGSGSSDSDVIALDGSSDRENDDGMDKGEMAVEGEAFDGDNNSETTNNTLSLDTNEVDGSAIDNQARSGLAPQNSGQRRSHSLVMGRYIKGKIIGRGSFGKVYKSYDKELQTVVAIKIVNLDCAMPVPNSTTANLNTPPRNDNSNNDNNSITNNFRDLQNEIKILSQASCIYDPV